MGWQSKLCVIVGVAMALPAFAADNVPAQIEAARAAYQKNDLPRTARALEAALADIHDRLGKALAETLPVPATGWQADPAELQGLGQVGGGLSVSRAYAKGESTLNATLFLDSPAVEAAAALLANPAATAAQPNMKRVKVGAEDALLRYDTSTKSGEITLVLNNRVLLELEGESLANAETLVETAKGWNVAKIRTLVGL
ncbi:MAG: hypothetical protein H7Y60_16320 [Rhodospirillaceae bacterium]|nr:hypothetical protein [Rhodospirillales bacterium]